jgi:preprotein translocase subunit SecG
MQQLITTLHIVIAVLLVILVLIQRGKGSEMGAGFGAGASGTMFGSQGATPFLVKLTAGLALLFFVSSGVLSFIVGRHAAQSAEGLPFATAPMKTVQPIPVSPEVQQNEAAPAVVAPAPVAETPVVKPAHKKEPVKKT